VGRRGSPKVALSDVATLTGVSLTTASFVLSGRRDTRISGGTQERLHQAARELSYVPRNPVRASLPVAPSIGFTLRHRRHPTVRRRADPRLHHGGDGTRPFAADDRESVARPWTARSRRRA